MMDIVPKVLKSLNVEQIRAASNDEATKFLAYPCFHVQERNEHDEFPPFHEIDIECVSQKPVLPHSIAFKLLF
jgi:hypothetical protein